MATPPPLEGVPPLMDILVLSPLAWIKREKERIGAVPEVKQWIAKDYFDALQGGIAYAQEAACRKVNHPEGVTGDRRRLEFALIQIGAHAVLLLEKIRSSDCAPEADHGQ